MLAQRLAGFCRCPATQPHALVAPESLKRAGAWTGRVSGGWGGGGAVHARQASYLGVLKLARPGAELQQRERRGGEGGLRVSQAGQTHHSACCCASIHVCVRMRSSNMPPPPPHIPMPAASGPLAAAMRSLCAGGGSGAAVQGLQRCRSLGPDPRTLTLCTASLASPLHLAHVLGHDVSCDNCATLALPRTQEGLKGRAGCKRPPCIAPPHHRHLQQVQAAGLG